MTSVATPSTIPTDSPEARRYNRIKRWLGIADFVLGLILLLALLVTGWSGTLRDLAYSGGFQNYTLAVFLYVVMLMGIGKLLGLGLDYYGFRLEHRFQLSNQKLRAWIWDEFKGFLVGVILASIVTELLYLDRKSTRLNSSHTVISYAVFCLKKKNPILNKNPSRWIRRE